MTFLNILYYLHLLICIFGSSLLLLAFPLITFHLSIFKRYTACQLGINQSLDNTTESCVIGNYFLNLSDTATEILISRTFEDKKLFNSPN